ncbi:SubName: Full=Related to WD40-repeat protein (Notchless protein) {ECO:0000313/EMBL:CCA73057.1} [Serendipita indica DSM 11827]|nr:SubName: Full=Related to WD40-repeat protein (Notchless protein) {ECO:0000313/EMBL:CCA73057.1} [Serendipita indica DSM 11827]
MNHQDASQSAGTSSRKRARLHYTAATSLDVIANIADATDILSPLKAACRTTRSILEVIQADDDNKEEYIGLIERLEGYMSAVEDQIDLFEQYPPEDRAVDEAFSRPLIRYVRALEEFQNTIEKCKRRGNRLGALTAIKLDAEVIRKFHRDIEDKHRQFMGQITSFTAFRVQAIERNITATREEVQTIEQNAAILQLPMVAFVASSVHNTCLQGTRQAVLQTIADWAEDGMSGKPIFWLCDIAGAGKSTVAMSATASWKTEGVLGGQFFFSMSNTDASTTEKFCSTMARELAHHIPELARHVAQAMSQSPAIMRSPFGEQFRTLITEPLQHRQRRVILVIDAVDECKSGAQRKELLETLATATRECSNLKIFITSRPDPVIGAVLQPLSIKAKLEDRLHDANRLDNINDIAIYVHQALDGVLTMGKRQRIIEKANGLFIWASTACRMLTSETNLSSPEDIYDRLISMDETGVIDDVYNLVFERVDRASYGVMCEMLALLLTAFEPLTVDDLDNLLKHVNVPGNAKALVQRLGSVLTRDATTNLIQFRHPTVVEYLQRCSVAPEIDNSKRVHLNLANSHGQLASWCFKQFKSPTEGLKFNICQIESSFYLNRQIPDIHERISNLIPWRLQYASSHWLFHVAGTSDDWRGRLKNELQHIIQVPHVLHWMEILSLIEGVPRAIAGLRAVMRHTGFEEGTRRIMDEIRRFIMAFSVPIQDSAPHIYISALPFTPIITMLHLEGLEKYANALTVIQGLETMYPGLPKTLRGPTGGVDAVTFSHDGSRIAPGSFDGTVRLWDADTGQPLGEPIFSGEGLIYAVAFSPDDSQIALGGSEAEIQLWDAETLQQLGEPFIGHEKDVTCVAFSPDGSRMVSGSYDMTIRLWDVETGLPSGEPLWGHEDCVKAVVFSPDGSRIISGSSDKTIRLWDAESRQPFGEPLRGHEKGVNSVAFSPDGSRIISGSDDATIRLWDGDTGQPLGTPLCGHKESVYCVSFSPDGSRIASGSADRTIRFGKSAVIAIVFSPDGSKIASGSGEGVQLWDARTGQPLGESQGHTSGIDSLALSIDGSRIVSGSMDGTIVLWDVTTGQSLGEPLQGHDDWVDSVAFSRDGSRIASGSWDATVRLWDVATGQPLGEALRGHDGWVNSVAFSPDGSRVVSGSNDTTVRLWDVATGQPLGEPLRGHNEAVNCVAFSPDGSRIASGSSDETILLWDAETRQQLGAPLRGHTGPIFSLAFSVDGSRIVSGHRAMDGTIRLWDVGTGQMLGAPLRGHKTTVVSAAFSPDGSLIVSSSSDQSIRLWDADSGQSLGVVLRDDYYGGGPVAFSPDGSYIVCCIDDTVQILAMLVQVIPAAMIGSPQILIP